MQCAKQVVFAILILANSWLAMQWIHELGHISAGLITGGNVKRLILDPLSISTTEVSPNPSAGVVVWAGPITGIFIPCLAAWCIPNESGWKKIGIFFAGFCLVANGSYIGLGSIQGIGDCLEMARTGTPTIIMIIFGIVTTAAGFVFWHALGSVREFFSRENQIAETKILIASAVLVSLAMTGRILFPA